MTFTHRLLATLLLLVSALPAAAQVADAKLDESLRETLARGCTGTQSVIIRTQPGYRAGLRDSLMEHGDVVKGEFVALDAVSADIHCDDLAVLASFGSIASVSVNAPVGVQSLGVANMLRAELAAVASAKATLVAARQAATGAQQHVRAAETAVGVVQAKLAAAQKVANRSTGSTRTAALATITSLQPSLKAAQDALAAARGQATTAHAATLAAQKQLVEAQDALSSARAAAVSREREGQAAKGLKKKFFASMPLLRGSQISTDEQIDTTHEDVQQQDGQTVAGGGRGIGVAVLDSGIEPGIDFADRITAFYDFTQGDIQAVTPSDAYGHGTHVAGLIASQFVGVATHARLIGLKVLGDRGQGTTDNVVRAIEFAVANKALLGIDVLNLSLGHPIFEPAATDPLVQAVEYATRAGITVVISAGNFGMNQTGQSGYAGIASPGNAPSGLSVGAVRTFNTVTRADDRVAPYSSRGPSWYDGFAKPDFVAAGDNLLSNAAAGSTLRLAQELRGNTGNYMRLSGTSMAAAVASGVVALMLEANHGLTPNTVKAVLEFTAIPVKDDSGTPYDALTQGAGQIEITGAVAYAQSIDPLAPVGEPWLSSSLEPATVIGGVSYAWSQSIIWGNRRVAGQTLLSEQRPAWALNLVWGEGLGEEDDNIVWGNLFAEDDNIVWGNSFDEDDNIVWGNNLVWGTSLAEDDNIVWGNLFAEDDNIVWGNLFAEDDNIVWGNNIVWGEGLIGMSLDEDDNIVWGNALSEDDDNIVWGNLDDDNVVWGNLYDDRRVSGNTLGDEDDDNIVWGNSLDDDDNIVWGNSAELGNTMQWSGGVVTGKADNARARRTRTRKEGVQ